VSNCRNCEHSIASEMQFCPHCGQKNTDGKVRVWSFLTVFINQVFNIESKLFKTMRDLFIPGKLTVEYFKGKHKTYFHPLRFFIVLAVLLIALISFFSNGNFISADEINISLTNETDTISLDENSNSSHLSSPSNIKKIYYAILFHQLDSLNTVNYQTQQYDSLTHSHIRQLVCSTLGDYEESINIITEKIPVGIGINKLLEINITDAIELNDDEIAEKYEVKGFINNLALKQSLKVYKGAYGFDSFILSNALWAGLLMMPFLALILMLFYFKQKHYYVEHLVFSFHIHSFIFLLFALVTLLQNLLNYELIFIILILAILGYILFAIKKVYGQTWLKTLLKFTGISICL